MSSQYKNNHYVPVWYQRRFLPTHSKDNELFYLDLKPPLFRDSKGKMHAGRSLHKQGFRKCFSEEDLYTTTFGSEESTKIEEIFFGEIDRNGPKAVEYFEKFSHLSIDYEAFQNMIRHMSTQKLRTPKGLGYLAQEAKTSDRNQVLSLMLRLRGLYCAFWTECIWQIADASKSKTKFILSDHPVTVYNRRCGPRSQWCKGYNDPDISLNGTHTIYPLSSEKILILTNLSWVRNPHKSELSVRPNPTPLRSAMFKYTDIQILRHLEEQEVLEINFIIKSRAYRYIAATEEEWLYPEIFISKSQWNVYGGGYLLMPDPRPVNAGGEIMWGNKDGVVGSIDSYGRRPWQKDYNKENNSHEEFKALHRFKGEFARLFGPYRRGRSFQIGKLDPEKDDEEYHNYHLSLEKSMR
jgi:uncharacterized protein DUF4238